VRDWLERAVAEDVQFQVLNLTRVDEYEFGTPAQWWRVHASPTSHSH
jgi:hypothetical protein